MKALLLAAGLGTRLRPLTDQVPKCMVDIGGQPLLDYWFRLLSKAGVKDVLVNLHYLPEVVRPYLASQPYGICPEQAWEPKLLGTGGTLQANLGFWRGQDTLLAHADNLCLCDFQAFFAAHQARPADCLMTMMLFRTPTPESCGIVEVEQGRVVAFHEKVANPPSNLANAAVYCLAPEFADWLQQHFATVEALDISTQVIPALMGRIAVWENPGYLRDIGNPSSYAQAQLDIQQPAQQHWLM
ncbi:nucleotidyltransferase family protein [Balneatrix alpica]|uniref:Nucleotidyltransferase family protein n=1 Tax=Balneatrix alpica TaxID=75684 RepID=A0ABV5ZGH7_9GAMM|nr:nucleotidyltransferase family protein [Balneatrix alpica]